MLVFFNEILIYSEMWKGHLRHVEKVFRTLEENQIYTNMSKWAFGRREFEYLGHIISE